MTIYDFNAFVDIINFKGDAKELSHSDFIEYQKGSMHHLNVKVVQFRKGPEFIFWKESLVDNCFQSAAFLLKKISCKVMKGNIDYFMRSHEREH